MPRAGSVRGAVPPRELDSDSRYDRISREFRLRPLPSSLAAWSLLAFTGYVFDAPSFLNPSTTLV